MPDGIGEFLKLQLRERADLFEEAARRRSIGNPVILEKDLWVCEALGHLFALGSEHPGLIFKGGTSLSKVYAAISRFSEDIDISIDRRALGFEGDLADVSAKARNRLLEGMQIAAAAYVRDRLVPALRARLENAIGPSSDASDWRLATSDVDPLVVQFDYPSVLDKIAGSPAYVRSSVRIELGARSDHWPAQNADVMSYIGQDFLDLRLAPRPVRVLAGERTFWEKATILHALYHRPLHDFQPKSLFRHYYDVVMLADGPIGQAALARVDLLDAVVAHKTLFFRSKWANYKTARIGTLRLAPHEKLAAVLRPDYTDMHQMIFGSVPTFERIIDRLETLEATINASASRS